MPEDLTTTIGLTVTTAVGMLACALAIGRVRRGGWVSRLAERVGVGFILLATVGLLLWRNLAIHTESWAPLKSHVDGLLLLAALLAAIIGYLQWWGRLRGVDVFALPVLTLLLAWGICASWWTFRPFAIAHLWQIVHLLSVYLGSAAIVITAAAGGMYLFIQRKLKQPANPSRAIRLLGRFGSLEAAERTMVLSATAAFVLVTVVLVTGAVEMATTPTDGGRAWWYSGKLAGSLVVWVIFAALMHVRLAPSVRGRRAAVLAIVGFVVLLGVLVLATSTGEAESGASETRRSTNDVEPTD